MGSCLSRTRLEKYGDYFEKLQLGELNDLWTTVRIYKIRQLFAKHASPTTNSVDFAGFKELLPSLEIYSNDTVKRIFEIFDREERDLLNFTNFLRGLSIFNFAPEETMLAIMFMIYDQPLEKTLKRSELVELYNDNKRFLLDSQLFESANDFIAELMKPEEQELAVDRFVSACSEKSMFNIEEYKRIFSVFVEERMEKELAVNFSSWNKLYNTEEQRYVSYVLSYKWFEAWRIYAEEHYKLTIDIAEQTQPKQRSQFKSKTRINTLKTIKTVNNMKSEAKTCRTLNFVHGDIGERPREIYNNVLEGQYEGILNPALTSNDYILVSEKVWNHFHMIYEGGPAFRRTGVGQIEMEPKLVKIYSSMFCDKLDYTSQVIREVPCSISPFEILTQSIEIPEKQLDNYVFFSKVIGGRWEKIPDLQATLEELHSEVMIFLVYLPRDQELTFVSNHINVKLSLQNINIGDVVVIGRKDAPKREVVFMGINNQGKMILHESNQNYKMDFCVEEKEFKMLVDPEETEEQHAKVQQKRDSQVNMPIGIKTTNGNSFISSLMPILRKIPQFKRLIAETHVEIGSENVNPTPKTMESKETQKTKTQTDGSIVPKNAQRNTRNSVAGELSTLLSKMGSSRRVSARNLKNVINIWLPEVKDNEETFVGALFSQIDSELRKPGVAMNSIQDLIGVQMKQISECGECNSKSEKNETLLGLVIGLPPEEELVYKVTYVPYSHSMTLVDIKTYAFKLKRGAKLKDYKAKLEETIGFSNKNYMLAEVYHNNIIKNFSTAQENERLDKLNFRECDQIVCYELQVDFQSFVKEHYRTNHEIEMDDIKVNHFIDCNNQDQGWILGKVCSVEYLTYTKRTIVSVIHKINRSEEWKIAYDLFQVALFPTQSYKNCEQFILRVNQRCFNESTNNMENVGMPLVVTLPEWMRWREFFFMMYLQMKKFIADEQSFEEDETEHKPTTSKSTKTVKDVDKKPNKAEQKKKLNKFKEYINSDLFPYKLTLVDLEGRCSICFRFVKDCVYKGESDTFCTGCKISEADPISWQVKCTEIMVCVDWKKPANRRSQQDIIRMHSTLANLSGSMNKDTVNLKDCMDKYLKAKEISQPSSTCCSAQASLTRSIQKPPEYLFITLNRVIEGESIRRLTNRMVQYDQQLSVSCKRGNKAYELCGVLYNDGQNRFCSVVSDNKGCVCQYNGDKVTPSSKKDMLQRRAYILAYKQC